MARKIGKRRKIFPLSLCQSKGTELSKITDENKNKIIDLLREITEKDTSIIRDFVNAFIKLLEERGYSFVDENFPKRSAKENKKILRDYATERLMEVIFGK